MDANVLQARSRQYAPQGFPEPRQRPSPLVAADDVRIVGNMGNQSESAIAASLSGAREQAAPVLGQANKQRAHIPIDIGPLRLQQLDAPQTEQQQEPKSMPSILVVLLLKRPINSGISTVVMYRLRFYVGNHLIPRVGFG